MTASLAESLALLPEAEQTAALAALSDKQAAQLEYDWRFWGRPEQFAPEGDWKTWAIIAGRGFGKTEAGAQWIRERVAAGARSIALIAETQKDLEEVMAARLVSIYPPKEAPSIRFKPVRLTWPNGAIALGYVGTEPNQLRGPEFDTAWCFIAGTIVETDSGPQPIERVTTAHLVRTRGGLRSVVANGSRVAEVGIVRFSDGRILIGTPGHPIYSAHGWTALSDLRQGDSVCAINASNGAAISGIGTEPSSFLAPEASAVSVASTWKRLGRQNVFCLTVAEDKEYFANGILVHNCDELAKYRYAQEVWDMLQFALRRSARPRQLITTTPRPIPLLKKVMADPTTTVTRGSTFDNTANLPSSFIDGIKTRYEGTRLGRQELNAEILDDVPGALWTRAMIDEARKPVPLPDMARVVVAVDPSGTRGDGDNGDLVGIIVAGKGVDGRFYVLADRSCKLSPAAWGRRAVDAYRDFKADRIVAERNFGGAMVEHVIRTVDDGVPYFEVTASRGKVQRAEPVAALYEQGRASHVAADPNELILVEDQLCQFAPDGYMGQGSPDRADALVWAASELMGGGGNTGMIDFYRSAAEAAKTKAADRKA